MKETHVVRRFVLLMALSAGSCLTGQDVLPAFRESNVPVERVALLRDALPRELDALSRRLDDEKALLKAAFEGAVGTLQRERVSKRYEMARRLVRCIREDLAKGDVSSLCFAELEMADLRAFLSCFAAEREAWATFPENPEVKPVELRLEDFGAKGDGVADDAPAFRAALAAVRGLGGAPSVLRIPEGTFLLSSPDPQTPDDRVTHLVFPALTNCIVTGVSPEKTRLRFGIYDARGLCARGGYNSVFRNFEIRWQETPFFEGEILGYSREEGWLDVSHDKGTLSPVDAKWQVRKHPLGLHTYRKDRSFIKTTLLFWNRQAQAKGDGTYRLLFDTSRAGWKDGQAPVVGAKAVLPDRLSGFEAFGLLNASLCTVDTVWVRNSREAFLQPSNCYQCSAVRCRIFPAEGRSFATNADGFYNSRGSWISDCEFSNMGDDGCNSVMHGGDIVKADGKSLLCKSFGCNRRPGDIWQIVESTTGEYLANLHVVSAGTAEWNGKKWWRMDFAEEIPSGVSTYENTGRGDITAEEKHKIQLGWLKLARPPDIVFAPGSLGVGYVARNNVFRHNRNTAMVVQCPNALLEGNRAEGMQNGIVVCALLQWNEGPAPYNVVLRDNVLKDNDYGILVNCTMNNGAQPRTKPVRHLLLENNAISGCAYKSVSLDAADGALILGGGCASDVRECAASCRQAGSIERLAPCAADSTKAVQAAIDKAFLAGGGTVRLAKGEYRVGGIRLRSRVTLYLEAGAVLKGSRDIEDYRILEKDRVEPVDPKLISHERWYQSDSIYKDTIWRYPGNRWNNALIRLYKAEDAAIVGEPGSLIDGSNPYDPEGEEQYRGPLGVNAIDCRRLTFRGYTTNNTGNWAHRLVDVQGFTFDGVTCLGGHDSVHFNGCDDVLIENCTFKTGDDCVAGFDNHRVTVRNCYINSSCSAFRFGGNDVLVEKCTIRGPGEWGFRGTLTKEQKMAGAPTPPGSSLGRTNMLSFFTYYADGTHPIRDFARRIVIRDCTVENTDRFLHYNYNNEQWQRGVPMTDIAFERVRAKGIKLPLCACGARGYDVKLKLTLKDCDVAFGEEVDTFIRGSYIGEIVLDNVKVSGVKGSLLLLKGGEAIPKVERRNFSGTDGTIRRGDFEVRGI